MFKGVKNISLDEIQKLFEPKEKRFKCECGNAFTHHSSLYRHKKTCKLNAETKPTVNIGTQNITNITIGTQNNINVYVMPYGEENTEYLTPDFLTKCLRRTNEGFVELLQHIHFHPEHIENHNLKITNKKSNFIEKYNGNRWQYDSKQKVIDELFKKGFEILDDHYYDNEADLKQKLSKCIMNNIDNFMKAVNNGDKDIVKPLLDGIYLLILNNSYMVLTKI